jgi:hypothetical protein
VVISNRSKNNKAGIGNRVKKSGKQNNSFIQSSAACAILAFIWLNICLNYLMYREDQLYFANAFLVQNRQVFTFQFRKHWSADSVLLGSSVMETPFGDFVQQEGFYSTRPYLLESALASKGVSQPKVVNLSIEAAMISDQFIFLKKCILGKSPIAILGITPRDFIDYHFMQPSETYTFHALVHLEDIDIWPFYLRTPEQYFKFFAEQLSMFFKNRRVLILIMEQWVGDEYTALFKYFPFLKSFRNNLTANNLANGEQFNGPTNSLASATNSYKFPDGLDQYAKIRFENSYSEYQKIYSHAKLYNSYA